MTHHYRAHGLQVDSDIQLPLARASESRPPDLVLCHGADRPVGVDDPDGEVLARLANPATGDAFYILAAADGRTVLRYPGLCEFVGDAGMRTVTTHVVPGGDPGVTGVLAAGALLAVHLRLRGELVLHASAVQIGERAVAFVGASGMGKSTMATLLCADGHRLLTDDVLRAQVRGCDVVVHPGSTETRLRDAARSLAVALPGAPRPTADGRLAVAPPVYTGAPLMLAACVVPRPRRDCRHATARRLSPAQALMLLSRFPRLLGWQRRAGLASEFQLLADLVERVGVYQADVPWGPPFRSGVGPEVLDAIGINGGDQQL